MGFIRGGIFVIVCVLFFVSLLLINSFFTIRNSLEYENVKIGLVPVVTNTLEDEFDLSRIVKNEMPMMKAYCENNSEFVFSEQGQTLVVQCDSVKKGAGAVINETINNFVEKVYYDDYDCNFVDCFSKEKDKPFFLVSQKTKNYFQKKLYWLIFISFIFWAFMYLLIEKKTNFPLIVGGLFIISSLPFLKLESFVSLFASKSYLKFFSFLFTQAYFVFLVSLIIGFIVLGAGVVLKFFVVGFKLSGFFSKFSSKEKNLKEGKKISKKEIKGIVKDEISKTKPEKKQ